MARGVVLGREGERGEEGEMPPCENITCVSDPAGKFGMRCECFL